ncbi:hypothetical protein JW758_04025 [Candidatus Peregrinibacteria bacterium]|nr:hypothetical protein [Candidatus Peregrinibacteria bacterium]
MAEQLLKIKLFFICFGMGSINSLRVQTPEGEYPALYRDLIAVTLARWANCISIVNVPGSDVINIKRIPKQDMEDVMCRMRLQGVEIIQN